MSRVLPSRFYSADPADLADELIAARNDEPAWHARQAIKAAQHTSAAAVPAEMPRRYLSLDMRRERIRRLTAAAIRKGHP
jgi:hypothetical protein